MAVKYLKTNQIIGITYLLEKIGHFYGNNVIKDLPTN